MVCLQGDKMRCVCPRRHYKCLDRPCSCIPYDKVCDGTTDCLNGIDEGPTCSKFILKTLSLL